MLKKPSREQALNRAVTAHQPPEVAIMSPQSRPHIPVPPVSSKNSAPFRRNPSTDVTFFIKATIGALRGCPFKQTSAKKRATDANA